MRCADIPNLWCVPKQELELLDVLFSASPEAAWRYWRSRYDFASLRGFDMHSLVPRLYNVLGGSEAALGADLPFVEAICKTAWRQNSLLENAMHTLLGALAERSVFPILLKGAALFSSVFDGMPQRPMHDCDLLVTPKELPIVWEVLEALRWETGCALEDLPIHQIHGMTVCSPSGSEFDIHWSLLVEWRAQEAADLIRDAAVVTKINGDHAEVIHPDDWLFMALVHGTHVTLCRSYWIPDVQAFLARGREIRWDRILDLAWAFHTNFRLWQACQLLTERFGLAIPAEVMRDLGKTKLSFVEKVELGAIKSKLDGDDVTRDASLSWVVSRYLQGGEHASLPGHLLGFVRFLKYHYQERSGVRALTRGVTQALYRALPGVTPQAPLDPDTCDSSTFDARM